MFSVFGHTIGMSVMMIGGGFVLLITSLGRNILDIIPRLILSFIILGGGIGTLILSYKFTKDQRKL